MKTVFLDRDGVINRNLDNDYVKNWNEFEFLPNSLEAIKLLTDAGYQLIVVTNQACIGKGIVSPQMLDAIHHQMVSEIENTGGSLRVIYHCPHRDDDNCKCRKPKPGMLIQAASEHAINLNNAYLIGDSMRDIEAGWQVGAYPLLVQTGHSSKQYQQEIEGAISTGGARPQKVFADLHAAALWVVSRNAKDTDTHELSPWQDKCINTN